VHRGADVADEADSGVVLSAVVVAVVDDLGGLVRCGTRGCRGLDFGLLWRALI
jgi:hypothetical protein